MLPQRSNAGAAGAVTTMYTDHANAKQHYLRQTSQGIRCILCTVCSPGGPRSSTMYTAQTFEGISSCTDSYASGKGEVAHNQLWGLTD